MRRVVSLKRSAGGFSRASTTVISVIITSATETAGIFCDLRRVIPIQRELGFKEFGQFRAVLGQIVPLPCHLHGLGESRITFARGNERVISPSKIFPGNPADAQQYRAVDPRWMLAGVMKRFHRAFGMAHHPDPLLPEMGAQRIEIGVKVAPGVLLE